MSDDGIEKLLDLYRAASDEWERLDYVVELIHSDPKSVMDKLIPLSQSKVTSDRDLAVWVMGELGYPRRPHLKQRTQILSECASKDHVHKVRGRALVSLRRLRTTKTDKLVLRYSKDESPIVREHVAQAIAGPMIVSPVKALIELSRDQYSSVREWAVFGLGNQDHSFGTKQVINALRKCIADKNEDVRMEAIGSLISQHDFESADLVCDYLEQENIDSRIVGAVYELQRVCLDV